MHPLAKRPPNQTRPANFPRYPITHSPICLQTIPSTEWSRIPYPSNRKPLHTTHSTNQKQRRHLHKHWNLPSRACRSLSHYSPTLLVGTHIRPAPCNKLHTNSPLHRRFPQHSLNHHTLHPLVQWTTASTRSTSLRPHNSNSHRPAWRPSLILVRRRRTPSSTLRHKARPCSRRLRKWLPKRRILAAKTCLVMQTPCRPCRLRHLDPIHSKDSSSNSSSRHQTPIQELTTSSSKDKLPPNRAAAASLASIRRTNNRNNLGHSPQGWTKTAFFHCTIWRPHSLTHHLSPSNINKTSKCSNHRTLSHRLHLE